MNVILAIWIAMRIVSYVLLMFIFGFFVAGLAVGETFSLMFLQNLAPVGQHPVAFTVIAVVWLVWAVWSWRFLRGS